MSNLGNKETMAKNLRYYLERSGKTQREMSEIIGVPTSTFNNWMKGNKYPRIDKIEMLADYFGILKSDLIEEKSVEHREMSKKNSDIVDATIKMRSNDVFFELVNKLKDLDDEKLSSILNLLK